MDTVKTKIKVLQGCTEFKTLLDFPGFFQSQRESSVRKKTHLIARKLPLIVFLGGCCSALTGQSKHKSVYNGESIFDTSSLQQRPITSGCSLCVPAVRSHAAQEADPCCG